MFVSTVTSAFHLAVSCAAERHANVLPPQCKNIIISPLSPLPLPLYICLILSPSPTLPLSPQDFCRNHVQNLAWESNVLESTQRNLVYVQRQPFHNKHLVKFSERFECIMYSVEHSEFAWSIQLFTDRLIDIRKSYLRFQQFCNIWLQVIFNSLSSSRQCATSYQQNSKNNVWEKCRKVSYL